MLEYMTAGSYVTHFFTDDPEYRKYCMNTYKEAFEAGLVKVGPTNYDPQLEANTSSSEGAKFKRCTSTVDAAIEFTCMALCDEFIGTAGSTVTYFVRALNKRYSTPFLHEEIIGTWHVPEKPTYNFRNDLRGLVEKSSHRLKENIGVNISHEQANVLDFLSDHHLEEMHEVLTAHLLTNDGEMIGSKLGDLFLKDCRVARMNKDRFKQCSHDRVGNQHWLKALLKGKLRQFSAKTASVAYHINMGPDAMIRLMEKPTVAKATGQPSSSSSSGPPAKKNRTM